jgi:serine/threonine-protein kinase
LKVLDFGIAKRLRGDGPSSTITHGDRLLGSPQYMSPEQIREAAGVDARADVWALGVALHELVTGAPPFHAGGPTAVLAAILVDPPASLREAAPDAPIGLEDVVLRCLERDPERRFPTARDLALALAPFVPDGAARLARLDAIVGASEAAAAAPDGQGDEPGSATADPLPPPRAEQTHDTWAERSHDAPVVPNRRRAFGFVLGATLIAGVVATLSTVEERIAPEAPTKPVSVVGSVVASDVAGSSAVALPLEESLGHAVDTAAPPPSALPPRTPPKRVTRKAPSVAPVVPSSAAVATATFAPPTVAPPPAPPAPPRPVDRTVETRR